MQCANLEAETYFCTESRHINWCKARMFERALHTENTVQNRMQAYRAQIAFHGSGKSCRYISVFHVSKLQSVLWWKSKYISVAPSSNSRTDPEIYFGGIPVLAREQVSHIVVFSAWVFTSVSDLQPDLLETSRSLPIVQLVGQDLERWDGSLICAGPILVLFFCLLFRRASTVVRQPGGQTFFRRLAYFSYEAITWWLDYIFRARDIRVSLWEDLL